jgi:hypothetical protein
MNQKFKVEMLFDYGWDAAGWMVDDKPMGFDSVEEAQAEIDEHIKDCHEAFGPGESAEDYRIVLNGPRFVLLIGDYTEVFPDIPAGLPVCFYDRKAGKAAITIEAGYANLICLESARYDPFTQLEKWLNSISPSALTSEDIPE